MRILIIGYSQDYHVGAHLLRAAIDLGVEAQILDANEAHTTSLLMRQFNWRFRGHRPARLSEFSSKVLAFCASYQPDCVLVTGITAPDHHTLHRIHDLGIKVVNYLTDDPWNPAHYAPWFFQALPLYTRVFSPRHANVCDLQRLGCTVEYLPFAYSNHIHFRELPPLQDASDFECDIVFYGGADRDRIPVIERLMTEGFSIHLYGAYWSRLGRFRKFARGNASPQRLRWAVSSARITLCLVRRANRDGHSMRTFEAAALGGCLLMENTTDHLEIFGSDLQNVAFFKSVEELVSKANQLLSNPILLGQLKENAHSHITRTPNTYRDRLHHMLTFV